MLSTVPNEETGQRIARVLVGEGLAACVNLVPRLLSIYRWQGELCEEAECLLLVKTRRERMAALGARLAELHPYSVPEVLTLPVLDGAPSYLAWLSAETR